MIFTFAGASISWASKRQASVALSTTEAEYMALAYTVKEEIWLKSFINECKIPQLKLGTTPIFEDNQGCIKMAKNGVNNQRTKHSNVRYHFTREQLNAEAITLEYLQTKEMTADILTKALPRESFERHREKLGLIMPEWVC